MQTTGNHIDICSGIGGFALAAAWAGLATDVFCEQDKFCQSILRKHWPHVPIVEDVFEFDGSKYHNATLLTAGFPCQPFSCAGKRRGKSDDRYIWGEIIRVIRESNPRWILLENVRGLVTLEQGLEFENMLLELEKEGYETRAFILPACSVDAPHKRERVWIVAYTNGAGSWGKSGDVGDKRRSTGNDRGEGIQEHSGWEEGFTECDAKSTSVNEREALANTSSQQNRGCFESRLETYPRTIGEGYGGVVSYPAEWKTDAGVRRISNGIPDRIHRIKSLGNAIVPQVAFQIIKGIKDIEEQKMLDI